MADKLNFKELHKHRFYTVQWKEGKIDNLKFDKLSYLEILKEEGYIKIDNKSEKSRVFIKLKNSVADLADDDSFSSFFFNKYIANLQPVSYTNSEGEERELTVRFIKKKFLDNIQNICKPILHNLLEHDGETNFLEDTRVKKYMCFKNCIIVIDENNIQKMQYDENKLLIWSDSILQHNIELGTKYNESNIYKFIHNICEVKNENNKIDQEATEKRILSLRTILGYLAHGYTGRKLKMPIFTDSKMSKDSEPNGRTGKSLIFKFLSHCMNANFQESRIACEIPAKNLDFKDKNRYGRAKINTKLLFLNDVQNYFRIENLFNDITDGCEIKEMYHPPFIIYTKMAIAANRSIRIDGESAKDRVVFFELSDHYYADNGPDKEFKEWFFSEDWNQDKWNEYFNFMIESIQLFLKHGIVQAQTINLEERTLQEHTANYFVNWMNAMISGVYDDGTEIDFEDKIIIHNQKTPVEHLVKYQVSIFYKRFITENEEFLNSKGANVTKFGKWINLYCKYKNIELVRSHGKNGDSYIFKKLGD